MEAWHYHTVSRMYERVSSKKESPKSPSTLILHICVIGIRYEPGLLRILKKARRGKKRESPPPSKVMGTRMHLTCISTCFAAVSLFLCHVVDYLLPNT